MGRRGGLSGGRGERTIEALNRDAVEAGQLAVHGDARRESTLAEAGVGRARSVVGAVDDSNVNIQVAIVTTQIGPHAWPAAPARTRSSSRRS